MKLLNTLFGAIAITGLLYATSCKKEDNGPRDEDTITANDTIITIQEYSDSGTILTQLMATSIKGDVVYNLKETIPMSSAIGVLSDGTIYISSKKALKYLSHNSIIVKVDITNEVYTKTLNVTVNLTPTDVQNRIINGETPSEIYSNKNSLLDSLDGKWFEYGYIIHFDIEKNETLLADTSNFEDDFIWGCRDTFLNTSSEIGEGKNNTLHMNSNCTQANMASKMCETSLNGGFDNWYLPSLGELQLVYDKLALKKVGSYEVFRYWSSTDKNNSIAQLIDFSTGLLTIDDKENGSGKVLAIRTYKE